MPRLPVPRLLLAACLGASGCAPAPPIADPRAARAPLPTPSPPGWFAFCAARGGTPDGDCDPVPRAAAMPDGRTAAAPAAWSAFCQRHRGDDACGR